MQIFDLKVKSIEVPGRHCHYPISRRIVPPSDYWDGSSSRLICSTRSNDERQSISDIPTGFRGCWFNLETELESVVGSGSPRSKRDPLGMSTFSAEVTLRQCICGWRIALTRNSP